MADLPPSQLEALMRRLVVGCPEDRRSESVRQLLSFAEQLCGEDRYVCVCVCVCVRVRVCLIRTHFLKGPAVSTLEGFFHCAHI